MPFKTTAVLAVACLLAACGQTTEPPSEPGLSLTADQVRTLNADRSLAGQRVAVVGYPLLCSVGLSYRQGAMVQVEIHETQNCRSPRLADATLPLAGEGAANPGFGATGVRPRNRLLAGRRFDNDSLTFLTDNYQVIPVKTPVRIAGVVTYPFGKTNAPLLEAVSVHHATLAKL